MATKTFKGRPALAGKAEGKAAVSQQGFNTCSSFLDVMFKDSNSAVCTDHDNKDLFGKDLGGAILCIPQTIGSSSAACLFMMLAEKNIGPKAYLFANHIDSLAACGLTMADIWLDNRTVTVDQLGPDFLAAVKTGDSVVVHEDGTVEVG
jgi:predicted aconitase with swiveling domain